LENERKLCEYKATLAPESGYKIINSEPRKVTAVKIAHKSNDS
jgi:hypothetical protein